MHMSVLVYIALGFALGLLYRWASDASRSYKKLAEDRAPGRNRFPLVNKIASILIAAVVLIGSMVLIGADRDHTWIRLALFLVVWLSTATATKHGAHFIRE